MNLTGIDEASSALIAQAVEGLCAFAVGGKCREDGDSIKEAILTIVLTIYRLGVTDGKIAGIDNAKKLLNEHFPPTTIARPDATS